MNRGHVSPLQHVIYSSGSAADAKFLDSAGVTGFMELLELEVEDIEASSSGGISRLEALRICKSIHEMPSPYSVSITSLPVSPDSLQLSLSSLFPASLQPAEQIAFMKLSAVDCRELGAHGAESPIFVVSKWLRDTSGDAAVADIGGGYVCGGEGISRL